MREGLRPDRAGSYPLSGRAARVRQSNADSRHSTCADGRAARSAGEEGKAAQERLDLLALLAPLPPRLRSEIVALWDEYEAAATPAARVAKALDKLETIMQHNQGQNPASFDYAFNLGYGARYTADHPVIVEIRRILDEETSSRAAGSRPG